MNKNKYLLDHEYDRLIGILDTYINKSPRDCLLIYMALLTGARASEVLNITFSDVNLYDESIFIRGLKNSNDREIPIPSKTFKHLISHLGLSKKQPTNESTGKKRIFPITYVRFHQIWDHYRPTPKKLHSLRHTFAIRLYKKTKDIRLLQFALGHRNIANTMVYADYIYSQQELKKLIL